MRRHLADDANRFLKFNLAKFDRVVADERHARDRLRFVALLLKRQNVRVGRKLEKLEVTGAIGRLFVRTAWRRRRDGNVRNAGRRAWVNDLAAKVTIDAAGRERWGRSD